MPLKKSTKERNVKSAQKGVQSINEKLKNFLKLYETHCKSLGSAVDNHLKDELKKYADDCKLLVRFTLQAQEPSLSESPIKLTPLIKTIRALWYKAVTELYFWDLCLPYKEIAALETFLAQPIYSVEYVEFLNCKLDAYSMERLSRCLPVNNFLRTLVLDFTKLNDEGLMSLSNGFQSSTCITKLSLCFCGFTSRSGSVLGQMVTQSAVNELYVDGNMLECDGLVELIRLVVNQAEIDAAERQRIKEEEELLIQTAVSENDKPVYSKHIIPAKSDTRKPPVSGRSLIAKKGKKKKKKKSGLKKEPARVGAWLDVLHIADNGIDNFTVNSDNVPLEVMRLLKRWIVNSSNLKEIDLDDNLIGELGGREILSALQSRKEAGLKPIHMKVTHRMETDTFNKINSLASGSTKRGKKKKKKKNGKSGKRRV
ncbi:uncharacterized protein LOC130635842 [Hydractinia symbiolongicarpus]|uniref:uncharacterized protein LOC130635842 n=1 Tax=Hydractinia symbiolongicarpus TaxID=13093 RepID=UPI00254DE20B|nr:uncharacterized protein LOC130635842 [Hydractinia symbiolongicarpus]